MAHRERGTPLPVLLQEEGNAAAADVAFAAAAFEVVASLFSALAAAPNGHHQGWKRNGSGGGGDVCSKDSRARVPDRYQQTVHVYIVHDTAAVCPVQQILARDKPFPARIE